MTNFRQAAPVVRALVEFFSVSASDLAAAEKTLALTTVCDQLSLSELKDELLEQAVVARMVRRFWMNPFDMENVFDLEDVLRTAVEGHALFVADGTGKTSSVAPLFEDEPQKIDVNFASQSRPAHIEPIKPIRSDNDPQTLVRYLQWANQVFYSSCAELPAGELSAERPMLFDNILNLLNHVYAMQRVWQAHLLGKLHDFTARRPDSASVLDFTSLWRKQAELDAWYVTYAVELPIERHNERITFKFIDGGSGTMARTEILQHVVNHASYHRGHIEGVFYQLGAEPPTTDLPVFLKLCGVAER